MLIVFTVMSFVTAPEAEAQTEDGVQSQAVERQRRSNQPTV